MPASIGGRQRRAALARVDALGRAGRGAESPRVPRLSPTARRLARGALVSAVLVPVAGVLVAVVIGMCTVAGSQRHDRRARQADRRRVEAELVDVADLFVLAVASGLNLRLALRAVAGRAPPSWAGALRDAVAATEAGEALAVALEAMLPALPGAARPLVRTLVSADRYGAPLLPPLEQVAHDARTERRRQAEERARRVPVKLLFPLVTCVLPAFGLLTVVPLLAGAVGSLAA